MNDRMYEYDDKGAFNKRLFTLALEWSARTKSDESLWSADHQNAHVKSDVFFSHLCLGWSFVWYDQALTIYSCFRRVWPYALLRPVCPASCLSSYSEESQSRNRSEHSFFDDDLAKESAVPRLHYITLYDITWISCFTVYDSFSFQWRRRAQWRRANQRRNSDIDPSWLSYGKIYIINLM